MEVGEAEERMLPKREAILVHHVPVPERDGFLEDDADNDDDRVWQAEGLGRRADGG